MYTSHDIFGCTYLYSVVILLRVVCESINVCAKRVSCARRTSFSRVQTRADARRATRAALSWDVLGISWDAALSWDALSWDVQDSEHITSCTLSH